MHPSIHLFSISASSCTQSYGGVGGGAAGAYPSCHRARAVDTPDMKFAGLLKKTTKNVVALVLWLKCCEFFF